MKKLYIDVTTQGGAKFYCSLIYIYNSLFKISLEEIEKFVNEKRPTVKYLKDVVLVLDDKKQVAL